MREKNYSIEDLLMQTDDDLFEILGRELSSNIKHGLPQAKEKLIKDSKQWFNNFILKSKKIICENQQLRQLTSKEDKIIFAGAISDLISHFCVGVPVGLVSVLIIKTGIEKICLKSWSTNVQIEQSSTEIVQEGKKEELE